MRSVQLCGRYVKTTFTADDEIRAAAPRALPPILSIGALDGVWRTGEGGFLSVEHGLVRAWRWQLGVTHRGTTTVARTASGFEWCGWTLDRAHDGSPVLVWTRSDGAELRWRRPLELPVPLTLSVWCPFSDLKWLRPTPGVQRGIRFGGFRAWREMHLEASRQFIGGALTLEDFLCTEYPAMLRFDLERCLRVTSTEGRFSRFSTRRQRR